MPRRFAYLAVEGPHDAAFIGRLLRNAGFREVRREEATDSDPFLDPELSRLVPRNFPQGNDLLARVAVPFFWQSEEWTVGIDSVTGDSQLVAKAAIALKSVDPPTGFEALGFLLDADSNSSVEQRYSELKSAVSSDTRFAERDFALPEQPGDVAGTHRRCGAYIFPDNENEGTLENLLLECGEVH